MTPPPSVPLPIDLDAEAIQVDGHWYTRDDLARKIKSMLDAGDFAIGKPSQALEQLTQHLSTLRTIAFRVTPEMADAINAIGARHGRSIGGIIREALAMHLGLPPPQEIERNPPRRTAPTGRRQTEPELPAVASAAPPPPSAPIVAPPVPQDPKPVHQAAPPPSQVIAGPGALKAAHPPPPPPSAVQGPPTVILDKAVLSSVVEAPAEEKTSPPTGPSVKKADEEGVERRWFGG